MVLIKETQTCTKEHPYDGIGKSIHPDAKEVGEQYDDGYGSYVKYHCPHCNRTFEVELPD